MNSISFFLAFIILFTILIIKGMNISDFISLIFIIYLFFLVYLVTRNQIIYYDSNFIPFKEICRYSLLSNLFIKNIIGNILLFIPMGMYLTYKLHKLYIIIILALFFPLLIEVLQLFINRVFDIDDIILNFLGTIIGYFITKLMIIDIISKND